MYTPAHSNPVSDQVYLRHDLPIGLVSLLQRVSAALVTFATLRIGMQINGTELSDPYQALLIIATLLALMLFPGSSQLELQLKPRFWNMAFTTINSHEKLAACEYIGIILHSLYRSF